MPRNISGIYTLPEAAFVAGTTILSASVNSDLSDIATALTQSLATTGVSSMTGPFKAATGSVTAPSITFGSATGTGFYLSGANEFSWTAAGILQATFGASGNVTWVGAQTFQSTITVTGAAALNGAATINSTLTVITGTEPVVTLRNSDNDTSEHELIRYALGSGAGTTASRRIIGGGANDVTEIRDYIGSTGIVKIGATYFKPLKNLIIDDNSIIVITTAGYTDTVEIAAPSNPSADTARLYAVDESGTTNYAWRDSAGVVSGLRVATQAEMEAASSLLRTVSPGRQHFHPGHPKAGGNLDGSLASPAFRTGDYGMGAVTDGGTGIYTLALDTAFADTNYWWVASGRTSLGVNSGKIVISPFAADTKTSNSLQIRTGNVNDGAVDDAPEIGISFWGDYA